MKLDFYSRLPGASGERERKLVEFLVGEVRYGVDIMLVREIVNPRELIPIPAAPAHVAGMADHRAKAVPVIDLRRRLGLEPVDAPRAKWVIVDAGGMDAAILVDQVVGVTAVSADLRRERHPLMSGLEARWVKDVFGEGDGLVFELELDEVAGGVEVDGDAPAKEEL